MDKPKNLGIAYNIKRKKKMASGGPVSAKAESRPMPEQRSADAAQVARNSSEHPLKHSGVLDKSTVAQAQSNNGRKVHPIKHPAMPKSSGFSVKLRSDEDHLMIDPDENIMEEGANRQGPESKDLKLKMMAEGGKIDNEASRAAAHARVDMEHGPKPEEDNLEEPAGLDSDNDQISPPEEEIMADHMAEGGEVEDDHDASIAAAIMARKRKMAEGGQVDIDANEEEAPYGEEFDHQNEDASLKENYDSDMDDIDEHMDGDQHGDSREMEEENDHDDSIVSAIRRKAKKSAMTR